MSWANFARIASAEDKILIKDGGWADKTFESNAETVTSHETNTLIEIQGSGYVVGLGRHYLNDSTFTIEIDDGTINEIQIESTFVNLFPLRFNNSIKINCSRNNGAFESAWVVLD